MACPCFRTNLVEIKLSQQEGFVLRIDVTGPGLAEETGQDGAVGDMPRTCSGDQIGQITRLHSGDKLRRLLRIECQLSCRGKAKESYQKSARVKRQDRALDDMPGISPGDQDRVLRNRPVTSLRRLVRIEIQLQNFCCQNNTIYCTPFCFIR